MSLLKYIQGMRHEVYNVAYNKVAYSLKTVATSFSTSVVAGNYNQQRHLQNLDDLWVSSQKGRSQNGHSQNGSELTNHGIWLD